MTRSSRVWGTLAAICTGTFLYGNALAAKYTFAGQVAVATGAFAALVPVGTQVAGPVLFPDAVVLAGSAGRFDFTSIDVNVGGFCFSTVPQDPNDPTAPDPNPPYNGMTNCPTQPSTYVPILSIDSASVQFPGNFPSQGTFSVTAFSPSFQANIPIDFRLSGTTLCQQADPNAMPPIPEIAPPCFFANGGGLGTASGPIAFLLPAAAAAPNPAAFADTAVGATESINVTVTNSGPGGLSVFSVNTGADTLGAPFSITADSCTGMSVAASGGTCVITVRFAPTAGGMFADSFDIVSTDPANDPLTVNVSGTAPAPQINVAPNPAPIPDTGIGTMSTADITVTNNGTGNLTGITVAGANALVAPFSILGDGCTGMTLGNLETCVVQVQFAPTAEGFYDDSFDIVSNDAANPSVTVEVSANALVPDISVAPSPLEFMATTVGESMLMTVTVSNDGSDPLVVGQLTTPGAPQFVVSNDFCSNTSLAVMGGSCTFDVTFTPTMAGMFMSSLVIPSNDPDTPTFTLNMSATGVAAPVAEIGLSTESLMFANVDVGSSASMDIVVTSTGNLDLMIDLAGLVITGADAADFMQTNNCPAALAPMATCTITVTFEPLTGGMGKMATLPVNSNADLRPMIDVALTGDAFLGARIDVDPTELIFGSAASPIQLGNTETADVTVTNTGNDNLVVTNIVFAGGAGEFSVDSENCTAGVVPGGSCTITVLFAPVTEGDKTGTMTIESNDADGLTPEVALAGFVFSTAAQISIAPNPAVFANTAIGAMSTRDVIVTNTGQADLDSIVVAGVNMLAPPFSVLNDGCTGVTLGNGVSCTIQLGFAPVAGGLVSDSFDIVSNDMTRPSVTVTVRGTGLQADIAVAPSPLDFMSTTVGESTTLAVTVSNNGTAQLDVGQITMPADMQFVVGNDLCSSMSLAPMGGSCTFDVTFTPMMPGMFMTSLDIPSNDPDTMTFTLNMSATAVAAPVAEIALSAEDLTFDEIEVGESATMDIVVTSTGTADLMVDFAALVTSGADAADFTQTNDCPAALTPMDTCTITVTFEPLTGGMGKTATLAVNSNADMRPMIGVTLAGSAFLGARINVEPMSLNFGSGAEPLELGTTVTASTTVTNSGNDDLVVTNIVIAGGGGEFSVDSEDCTAGVAPDASCTVTVAFTPVTDGDKMGTMTIESNDADGLAPEVALTGFVFTGARVEIASLDVDVDQGGTVEVGMSNSVDIVIGSTGTQDLEITNVELGGTNPDQFSITEDCTAGAIASGSGCTIGVTFAPTSSGAKSATITVSSNDVTQQQRAPTTVIAISGNAVNPPPPPPPPPPPLSVPPSFTQNDDGGVGATSLWLLASGLGLLALRRRRRNSGARMSANHTLAGAAVALIAAFMLVMPGEVRAISFESESGDISGSWDTTLSYGLAYRLQAAADNLIGTVNGGTKYSVNGDDGTLNFHRGIYSNALKVTSEIEINYSPANISLFMRGFYLYDFELENGTRDRTPLSDAALDLAGSDGDLLDAFVSWQFDIGDRPAELRVGEQVVNWGESTFIQGGMNVINHINVSALRVPGAELREALLPQDLVFFSIGVTPSLDFELIYQYDWDDTEPDPAGTYFSTNDFAVDGGNGVRLGFGDTPDTPPPAFFTPEHAFNAIPRGDDRVPADDGQWGWAARYFAADFNNGTEFGFYYYNYHSRLPLISARTGSFEGLSLAGAIGLADEGIAVTAIDYLAANPGDTSGAIAAGVTAGSIVPDYIAQGIAATAITRGLPTALGIAAAYSTDAFANTPSTGNDPFGSPAGETAEYFTVFPEDIQLYGLSWNTTLGQTAWQGEIAHHQNRPLQVDDLELLFAGLSSLRATFAQFGQLGSFSFVGGQANPNTPPLTTINGYYRRDYTQANMAFTRLFSRVFGADQGVALFEVAYHHVHGFPSKDVLRFDAAATVVSGNPDLAEIAHPGKPILPADVFPDADSYGYRLAGRLDYSNVLGSFNMSPRLSWQHDVKGITPGPAGAFIEDRKAITVGNRFSYQNKWELDFSYSRFFGAGFQNEIHDRDFVAASVKFTF